jgi:peptidoglycan-associated lipoprotein
MNRRLLSIAGVAILVLLAANCCLVKRTPPPPKAVGPADGSRVATVTPTLEVTKIEDADQYQWTIEGSDDSVLAKGTSAGPSWSVPRGVLANSQKYEWTARAQNSHGWGKDFDPEWSFTVDIPLPLALVPSMPANGGETPTLTPMLQVQGITDAQEYQWSVKDSTGKEVAKATGQDPSWTVTAGALADKMKYTWTAQARNDAGWGPAFTPEWSFRVKIPPPPPPPAPPLTAIHFDFDKYDIRPGDARTLDGNGSWLKSNAAAQIRLEGYCDPIGTEEYNRGLGLRRANSAKSYLVRLGIDAGRMSVISFGKENLVTNDSAQYELNRRVEFKSR